jgi:hypothetical protein
VRAKTKGSWEVEGKVRRQALWTAGDASSPARETVEPVAQMAWGQTAAEAAEIASVTAAYLREVDQGVEVLLVAARED